ncbi:hypothetical protein ACNKHL_17100 [Shigella flexneri]
MFVLTTRSLQRLQDVVAPGDIDLLPGAKAGTTTSVMQSVGGGVRVDDENCQMRHA